ncbi:MAG: hypothetical protein KGN04_02730 [Chloroflexi bacterium]|nr:hypothetical protein [Chloroflexota bacterium]
MAVTAGALFSIFPFSPFLPLVPLWLFDLDATSPVVAREPRRFPFSLVSLSAFADVEPAFANGFVGDFVVNVVVDFADLVAGFAAGFTAGFVPGLVADLVAGFAAGFATGLEVGLAPSLKVGLVADLVADVVLGFVIGFAAGFATGLATGFEAEAFSPFPDRAAVLGAFDVARDPRLAVGTGFALIGRFSAAFGATFRADVPPATATGFGVPFAFSFGAGFVAGFVTTCAAAVWATFVGEVFAVAAFAGVPVDCVATLLDCFALVTYAPPLPL